MAAIDARYSELEEDKLRLQKAYFRPPKGQPRLSEEFYYEQLHEITAEQEQLSRRRMVNRDALPLRDALRQQWTIEAWESRPVEWRRAVIKLLTERIEVTPALRRGAAKGT